MSCHNGTSTAVSAGMWYLIRARCLDLPQIQKGNLRTRPQTFRVRTLNGPSCYSQLTFVF